MTDRLPSLAAALNEVERVTADLAAVDLALALDALEALRGKLFRRCLLAAAATNGATSEEPEHAWWTVAEAAESWRKSACWVRRQARRGQISAEKFGGEWRIRRAAH